MNKNFNCRIATGRTENEKFEREARYKIKELNKILEKFENDNCFKELCEIDYIELQVGIDTVRMHFTPMTWDATENFIMHNICCLIVACDFDQFPYYEKMLNEYSSKLGILVGDFGC